MPKPGTCPTCGQALPAATVRPNERALLEILSEADDIAVRALAEKAGRSPEGAFDRTLTEMARKGLLVRRNGRVRATDAGRAAAAQ